MIVTAQSFRGGVGKSSIITNLAIHFALEKLKTAITDLDIFAPSLHLRFDKDPRNIQYTINDFLLERCELDKVKLDVKVAKNASNIQFYPSSIELKKLSELLEEGYNLGRLSSGLREIEKENDIVLIDNHSSITEEAIGVLSISDIVLLVTSPDLSAMEGIFMWRDVVEKFGINDKQVFIILNKVLATKQDLNKLQDRLQRGAQKKADYIFFYYEEVALGSSHDCPPMRIQYPNSVFSKNITQLGNQILKIGKTL